MSNNTRKLLVGMALFVWTALAGFSGVITYYYFTRSDKVKPFVEHGAHGGAAAMLLIVMFVLYTLYQVGFRVQKPKD